jgi:hypothetical protein
MSQLQRVDELEIEQDLTFQRRIWRVQRIGWLLIALILVAALLGLFGSGPLSRAVVSTPDGAVQLDYPRFTRYLAPAQLRLTVQPAPNGEDTVTIWFNRQYLHELQIEQITPAPQTAVAERIAGEEGIRYHFSAAAQSSLVVEFYLETEGIGLVRGQLTVGNQPPLEFWHFIYP